MCLMGVRAHTDCFACCRSLFILLCRPAVLLTFWCSCARYDLSYCIVINALHLQNEKIYQQKSLQNNRYTLKTSIKLLKKAGKNNKKKKHMKTQKSAIMRKVTSKQQYYCHTFKG